MNDHVGKSERATQNRVVKLLRDELGYRYLGNWEDRENNSNIDEKILSEYLEKAGYSEAHISKAIYRLKLEANSASRGLYENNQAVYMLLRYGVNVQVDVSRPTENVNLIDWDNPAKNDFAVAEEVTLLAGTHERRPDVVLYINGIAFGVLELKNSRVSVNDGIRQSISNQSKEFNEWFFTAVQFVFAGNDTEGLRYGTIGTPEKFFLQWKEDEHENDRLKLDKYLLKMCNKSRMIELMHDFVLFDGGIKKLPRVHQYFGVKKAQERIAQKKGGVIWHTQGSGKSIVMVMLAKWILEKIPTARVAVITDRDELDSQISKVFAAAGEKIARATSCANLMDLLGKAEPRLLCSLVHKFGQKSIDDFDEFIKGIKAEPTKTKGDIFVFVDECHRTQSGKLHKVMKAMMPEAIFIGFTGTPLLKTDKATSLEVFGTYIHTYKFGEAVEDKVVLDLVYESRDIEQKLGSQEKVDEWFEHASKGLNEWKRAKLKEEWGTMQQVLSSKSRMSKIVQDIVMDFKVRPRLVSQRGNAILVAGSILEACKYFELLQGTSFRGKCAIITSYNPHAGDISLEDSGANTESDKTFIYNTYSDLVLKDVVARPNKSLTEVYEEDSKDMFIKKPASMKLLVVVDKLLTGFDAPHCTYLYIDKSMQDHGLFQAICRTNRLDGEDKEFGYIVDYKDLFKKVEDAIEIYTSELANESGQKEPRLAIKDRLNASKKRLDASLEALESLCEGVQPPKGELEYIQYFCGNTEIASDLEKREPQRTELYKAIATYVRAYASIAGELNSAGYTASEAAKLAQLIEYYIRLRDVIRRASGEELDLKSFEADMRYLIDTYIEAKDSVKLMDFGGVGLLRLIDKLGIEKAMDAQPEGMRRGRAAADVIGNNIRAGIRKSRELDPAFYDKMSQLLDEVLADLREKRIEYAEYLVKVEALAKKLAKGHDSDMPSEMNTQGQRALFNNIKAGVVLSAAGVAEGPMSDADIVSIVKQVQEAVLSVRQDSWRGNQAKENTIKRELYFILKSEEAVEKLFVILKNQSEY